MAESVPAFDDIPSFDDLPDAAGGDNQPQQNSARDSSARVSAIPRFDDIPSFDDLPDEGGQRPAPEGPVMSGLREAAHSVIPAAAGLVGAGVGGAAGALTSPVTGPVGPFVGGVAGMVAGSMGADALQERALKSLGFDDSEQRAANAAANPKSSFVGGLAPAVATMSPVKGVQAGARALGAGMMGGFEAGQEYLNEGEIDPAKVAIAAATGAVFPAANRVGEKLMDRGARMVPGRPNRSANKAADQAHADVDDTTPETAVGDSSLAEPPPGPDGVTTGNPQSAPQRSDRVYAKTNSPAEQARYADALSDPEAMRQFAHEEGLTEAEAREIAQANYEPSQGDMLTQGDMDPATSAALEAANPQAPEPAAPEAAPPVPAQAPAPQPAGPNAAKPKLGLKSRPVPNQHMHAPGELDAIKAAEAPPPATSEPVVDAGFPKTGEPVATGENEATAMPPAREMPDLQGKTNASPSDAQKVAGNYEKARTHDFGKPMKIETAKGETRRSLADAPVQWENQAPADYGYFNKTKGADKDHIDFYRAEKGSPEAGDKHFIIDQKDADTGKFDEHKVMTYFKDLDAARDTYLKGFSDEKGLARLNDINEIDRKGLVAWLAKHSTKAASEPYGTPIAKEKPQPKVVAKAIELARSQGQTQVADAIEKSGNAVEAAKYLNAKTNKTGKSDITTARIRPAAPEVPGAPGITARSKADAAKKGAALEQMKNALEANPPSENESPEAMRTRLQKVVADAGNSVEVYKPAVKPPAYLYVRKAQQMLTRKNWKPEHIAEFQANEKLARSTNAEDHALLRGGNRIEADIARSKRSGDTAISNAENQQARFDVPHEEAESMVEPTPVRTKADLKELPRKTIDVADSPLGIDTSKISRDVTDAAAKRKVEAATLAGKKAPAANVPSEEKKAGAVKPRNIREFDETKIKEMIERSNQAAAKKSGMEALPAEREPVMTKGVKDLYDHFVGDERGSVDLDKIRRDFGNWMKKTPAKSYRAMELRTPHDEYVQSLSDDLHRIKNEDVNHFVGALQKLSDMPADLKDEKVMERIYHARDADSAGTVLPGKQAGKSNVDSLPPDLKALYDQHLKPLFDENDMFVQNIRGLDEDRIGPDVLNHISRIQKGDTADYNMLKSEDDPMAPAYSGLSVNANAAKTRKFYALERAADGRRSVIQPTDKGYMLWDKGKPHHILDPDFAFGDGNKYTVQGKNGQPIDYNMRQATTKEIMDNARGLDNSNKMMDYYTNAGFSAAVANAQLGSMARHLAELAKISETDRFKKLSTTNPNSRKVTELGFRESTLPNFRGTYMHPELKKIFDDFAGHPQTPYRQLNTAVTKLLFWMPTAHINNVGAHWFVGRGWDNMNVKSLLETAPKAIKSVINQDAYQMAMRSAGAGTVYGRIITKDMMGQVAKQLRLDMQRNPSKYGPIADAIGVPLRALTNSVYHNFSSKLMWSANDMFLTQRVMELERKGTPMRQAIIEAERDIPNYRIPHKLVGRGEKGMAFAGWLGDPAKMSFGRYHAGMWNSYANIIKDAIGNKATLGDRVDAAGKMLAMGVLATAIYPLLDKAWQKVTGNEHASAQRRGPVSIPSHALAAAQGKEDIASAARSTFTLPPLRQLGLEALSNKDFRGKPIVEPGDVRKAFQGDAGAAGHVAAQAVGHAARGLISPLNTAVTAYKKKVNGEQQGIGSAVRDQALDIKDPSDKAVKYERMIPIKTVRDARARRKQGDW